MQFERGQPGRVALRVVLAVAVVAAVVAPMRVAASAVAAPAPVPAPPHPVDIYGDSVVAGATAQVNARLRADGWAPQVRAISGASLEQIAGAVIGAKSISDVVVIVAGYNYFWKPVILRRDVDNLLFALSVRNVRRVIWLNVREDQPDRRDVNNALNRAWQRWGNLEVPDWNRFSRDRSGDFLPDGHHLLPAGGRLMADLIDQRLDAYRAGAPRHSPPVYGAAPRETPVVAAYGRTQTGDTTAAATAASVVTRSPFVGIASTRRGNGYWLAQRDGAVLAFGDAPALGGAQSIHLHAPIVAIAATPSGKGYWLVGGDGGVFSFGDARFHGSTGAMHLAQPVIGIAATPTGRGYWLAASDGGIFSFGDARFYGSTGAIRLAEPVVGMAPLPGGNGYWLVAYDGGIFSFGAARFRGSAASVPRFWKIEAIAPAADGKGYWVLAANGEVISFGSAARFTTPTSLSRVYVGIAPRPADGFWLVGQGLPSHH